MYHSELAEDPSLLLETVIQLRGEIYKEGTESLSAMGTKY